MIARNVLSGELKAALQNIDIVDTSRAIHHLARAILRIVEILEQQGVEQPVEPVEPVAKPRTKLVAVLGGGDWTDASVAYLVIPYDLDIAVARDNRNQWYREAYFSAQVRGKGESVYCPTLVKWLIEHHGARNATEDEIDVFDNT